jgi:polycomb protein EED
VQIKVFNLLKSINIFLNRCHAKEDHGQPIFGCQFHLSLKDGEPNILATVGSKRVTIYECPSNGTFVLVQVFEDPDVSLIKVNC